MNNDIRTKIEALLSREDEKIRVDKDGNCYIATTYVAKLESLVRELPALVEVLENYRMDRKIAHDIPGTGMDYAHHYKQFGQALTNLKQKLETLK